MFVNVWICNQESARMFGRQRCQVHTVCTAYLDGREVRCTQLCKSTPHSKAIRDKSHKDVPWLSQCLRKRPNTAQNRVSWPLGPSQYLSKRPSTAQYIKSWPLGPSHAMLNTSAPAPSKTQTDVVNMQAPRAPQRCPEHSVLAPGPPTAPSRLHCEKACRPTFTGS